jgi:hypothetical protein
LQGLLGVNDANFWLSASASLPFWKAKPFELDDEGVEEGDAEEPVGEGVFDDVGETEGEFCVWLLPVPVVEGTPGDDT